MERWMSGGSDHKSGQTSPSILLTFSSLIRKLLSRAKLKLHNRSIEADLQTDLHVTFTGYYIKLTKWIISNCTTGLLRLTSRPIYMLHSLDIT